jgi:hypothetical protein
MSADRCETDEQELTEALEKFLACGAPRRLVYLVACALGLTTKEWFK